MTAKSAICGGWDALCKSGGSAESDVSYLGRSPRQWAGDRPQNDGQPALNAVEKSAEGIVSGWRH